MCRVNFDCTQNRARAYALWCCFWVPESIASWYDSGTQKEVHPFTGLALRRVRPKPCVFHYLGSLGCLQIGHPSKWSALVATIVLASKKLIGKNKIKGRWS